MMTEGTVNSDPPPYPILSLEWPATMLQISPMASLFCAAASSVDTPSICEATLVADWSLQRRVKMALMAPVIPITPVTWAITGQSAAPGSTSTTEAPTMMEKTSAVVSRRTASQSECGVSISPGFDVVGAAIYEAVSDELPSVVDRQKMVDS